MRPDFRWLVLFAVELALFVALIFYGNEQSWSNSYGMGALTGYLAGVMFVNETIERLARRAERRRGLHR